MSIFNKKLELSIPIFVVIIVTVTVTTILMNNKKPETEPSIELPKITETSTETTKMDTIVAIINGENFEIKLEDNSTVSALLEKLPMSLSMSELNGNEKYVYLDESLPTHVYNPKHIEAGDVMLYGDNCLVVFYKSFDTSYSYTKIGHIDSLPNLGSEDVEIELK